METSTYHFILILYEKLDAFNRSSGGFGDGLDGIWLEYEI